MIWSYEDWVAAHRSDLDEIAYLEAELVRITSRVKARELALPGVAEDRRLARKLRDARRKARDDPSRTA